MDATQPIQATQPKAPVPAQPGAQPVQGTKYLDRKDDNVVYVGKKEAMSYVLAVITNFNKGSAEVIVKARGHMISRAVDVAEIVKHRFMPGVKVKDIRIMTEDLVSRDGRPSKVSAMELVLVK